MAHWILLIFLLALAGNVSAQEVPFVSDDPVVRRVLDQDMFDFVTKTLGSARLAPHLKCTLKTRSSRELRKFSDGEKWVETLEINYNTNGFDSGQKVSLKIPMTAKYGTKEQANQWSGLGETIKIEVGDYYGYWIIFTHDGKNGIVGLNIGNRLGSMPCQIK